MPKEEMMNSIVCSPIVRATPHVGNRVIQTSRQFFGEGISKPVIASNN